jgi:hypothetical protein
MRGLAKGKGAAAQKARADEQAGALRSAIEGLRANGITSAYAIAKALDAAGTRRATLEPMSMQSPFAAGRNKLIADQCFQMLSQLVPSREGGRAADQNSSNRNCSHRRADIQHAPHCRGRRNRMALNRNRHHVTSQSRCTTILREQCDLFGLPGSFVENFDGLAPFRSLGVVYLSEVR